MDRNCYSSLQSGCHDECVPLLSFALPTFSMVCAQEFRSETTKAFLMAQQKVQNRLGIRQDRPDFLSHLKKAREGLSDTEIESTAGIIIIAGSSSLTTTLVGTTNFLLRFPQTLEMLFRRSQKRV